MVKKYHKKPVEAEALQLTKKVWEDRAEMEQFADVPNRAKFFNVGQEIAMAIFQRTGYTRAIEGDWIVKTDGVLSIVKPVRFKTDYTAI